MRRKKIHLLLLAVLGWILAVGNSYAVSLDLIGGQSNVMRGSSFTVDLVASDASELNGIAVSLAFPENDVALEVPGVTTTFFDVHEKNLVDGEGAGSVWSSARTNPPGSIHLTGLAMKYSTAGVATGPVTLFSAHFRVKNSASEGIHFIRLASREICNGPAGWGTDNNNNGVFDAEENDLNEAAPLLYSFVLASRAGYDDIERIDTKILIDGFDEAPFIIFNVLPGYETAPTSDDGSDDGGGNGGVPDNQVIDTDNDGVADDEDGCPTDPGKIEPGTCGCGVADADSDFDGIPDCIDVLIRPANGETDTSLSPVFEVEPFPNPESAGAGASIVWQISKDENFTDLMFEYTGEFDVTILQLPDFILDEFTTYYWRIRYGTGAWEAPGEFTTGPDPMVDVDGNGIPDDQDLSDIQVQDNVINIDNSGKILQSGEHGLIYGLAVGENVTAIDRFKWQGKESFETAGSWPVIFADGLLAFRLKTMSSGVTVNVTIGFSETMPVGSTWWATTVDRNVYNFDPYAVFADDMRSVTLALTDGGSGDLDGVANGVIVDPGGIVRSEGKGDSGDSGGGGGSSGCFIETCLREFP